jgi:hypothetical protein
MTDFRLQFDPSEIRAIASRYAYEDDARVRELGRRARERGWYTRAEFIEICEWKTVRIRSRVDRNSERDVVDATTRALSSRDGKDAIEALRNLHGVDWAVASVFLHLGHRERFPMIDFRALQALGVHARTISKGLWDDYVDFTRSLARRADVDMRTLDRALWQWSNEHGGGRNTGGGGADRSSRPRRPGGLPSQQTVAPMRQPSSYTDVVILGCVSSKAPGPARAKDIYLSPLWRKRRAFAEASGRPWVIFSAKHGILDPDEVIEWYDVALAKLPTIERQRKGRAAVTQLEHRFGTLRGMILEIHAGGAYAGALAVPLAERGAMLVNPLEGLSIGYQLQWYGRQRPGNDDR